MAFDPETASLGGFIEYMYLQTADLHYKYH
jgi:hypothetical protein